MLSLATEWSGHLIAGLSNGRSGGVQKGDSYGG